MLNLVLRHFIRILMLPWFVDEIHFNRTFLHVALFFGVIGKLGNYLCHPLVFKEGEADSQDKGDESNEEEGDGRKLKPVSCLRGPLLECSVVRSVVPFLYPIVCGFRTCDEE